MAKEQQTSERVERKPELRVDKVTLRYFADGDADTSYLEQEGFEDRLAQYKNGQFNFIGIRAECEVSYAIGNDSRRIEHFTSGGLWGIEDDSDKEYLASVEQEELADLLAHLQTFGIETTLQELQDKAERL